MKHLLLCFLYATLVFGIPTRYKEDTTRDSCGYQSCTGADPNKLNVHIVPHSHDDVGWLKTVDQYYWGARNNIQKAGVQYIIDSVITALDQNPNRRFVQVETAFFYKWWKEQNEERRGLFKKLVDDGRLEIINGAWSMNDEAGVNYQSVIDQFTVGLRTINDTLGECGRPRIGWQIDPFGHSKEMASIFTQMGFDAMFLARLDWRDKNARLTGKTAEMLWQGSANLGDNSDLFTSVLFNHYSAPSGFCFDVLCTYTPVIDDEDSPEYNYKEKIEDFANFIRAQADNYATNNIIITMGDDFNYQDALSYFTNLDKIIKGFRDFVQTYQGKTINVFYSTPSCYIKAVSEEAASRNLAFPLKTDDFLPYATDYHSYWTGYYTSRPTSKRFERDGNNILQVTKQLVTFIPQSGDVIPELRNLQEAMGIMQHHDAITGTEKQHVADDYHRILTGAVEGGVSKANNMLSILLTNSSSSTVDLNLRSCMLANVSVCSVSQSDEFIVAVYNPLSRIVSHYVRLPVSSSAITVEGPYGESVATQILPTIDSFAHISDQNPASLEMVFYAEGIPALGTKLYKITVDKKRKSMKPVPKKNRFQIGDNINGLKLDETTGRLHSITLNGTTLKVRQELMYYVGSRGDNEDFESRASGAYIFRPSALYPRALSFSNTVKTEIYIGDLIHEVHQEISPWVKQIIRLYRNTDYVEFDWLVGPIDVSDDQGKEVISRFTTTLKTNDIFYTDANGREMVRRKRDYRETYEYSSEEPISGNYYPVTSRIRLKDDEQNLEFAVLTDRAQGGSSLESGQVELMVHRRLLDDDAFGVDEALNEEQFGIGLIARGQHYVTFGSSTVDKGTTSSATQKDIAQKKLLAPWIFLTNSTYLWNNIDKEFSGLARSLPENVQILTLEPWKGSENTLLLRLEHVFEKYEDGKLSEDASVNVDGLFKYFDVVSIQEMTLGGNQLLEENERLKWIVGDDLKSFTMGSIGRKIKYVKPSLRDKIIDLTPMQIRTFILTVIYK